MLESRFEKLLKEEIKLMTDMMVQGTTVGHGASDFGEYKYNLGYINALSRVLDAIEKVKDDMGKE